MTHSSDQRPDVYFDLDGTLTDPKIGITTCIQYALEAVNVAVPAADDLTWCIGPPLLESLATLAGDEHAAAALVAYRVRFSEVGWSENEPYEGIHDVLARLSSTGFRLCVATSKPHRYANQILNHFDLRGYFDQVFGAEMDGTRSDKAQLLRYALDQSSQTHGASMIGDRSHDIIGALANRMEAIGVTYGYGSEAELVAAGAHTILNTPAELTRHAFNHA